MSAPLTMSVWDAALAEWGDGPRTMKATADWANRWVHELRTASERDSIELSSLRARLAAVEAKAAAYDLTHTGGWLTRAHAVAQRASAADASLYGRDVWHICVEQAERLAEVEAERDEVRKLAGTLDGLHEQGQRSYDELAESLALAQAQAARMRADACELLRAFSDRCALHPEADRQHIIDGLLSEWTNAAPLDVSALDAVRAEERERCMACCDEALNAAGKANDAHAYAAAKFIKAAIRALGGRL